MDDWKADLKQSSRDFLAHVWPVIQQKCGGGEIKPVEVFADNDLAHDLDVLCGIDVWQTVSGEGARGIASRVQPTSKNWQTFTVRRRRFSGAKTEYQKRLDAINSNGRFIYPYLTCQAYVDGHGVIGLGLARTVDIYAVIEQEKSAGRVDRNWDEGKAVWINGTHNADFFCVRFEAVPNCWTYERQEQNKTGDRA